MITMPTATAQTLVDRRRHTDEAVAARRRMVRASRRARRSACTHNDIEETS
jgi:hypothetical protein